MVSGRSGVFDRGVTLYAEFTPRDGTIAIWPTPICCRASSLSSWSITDDERFREAGQQRTRTPSRSGGSHPPDPPPEAPDVGRLAQSTSLVEASSRPSSVRSPPGTPWPRHVGEAQLGNDCPCRAPPPVTRVNRADTATHVRRPRPRLGDRRTGPGPPAGVRDVGVALPDPRRLDTVDGADSAEEAHQVTAGKARPSSSLSAACSRSRSPVRHAHVADTVATWPNAPGRRHPHTHDSGSGRDVPPPASNSPDHQSVTIVLRGVFTGAMHRVITTPFGARAAGWDRLLDALSRSDQSEPDEPLAPGPNPTPATTPTFGIGTIIEQTRSSPSRRSLRDRRPDDLERPSSGCSNDRRDPRSGSRAIRTGDLVGNSPVAS